MINEIYNIDNAEILKQLADKSVDLILEDMPYNTTALDFEYAVDLKKYWQHRLRIIKDNGAIILTASQPFTSILVTSKVELFRHEIIWQKNYSGSFVNAKKQPMKYHENILIFSKKSHKYNPQFEKYAESTIKRFSKNGKVNSKKMQNISYKNEIQKVKRVDDELHLERGCYPKSIQFFKGVPNCNGLRVHPTQKPIELFRWLIRTYTNAGDLVFDGFAGSGTTGLACISEGRNFICCENDEDYFNKAKKRIEDAKLQKDFTLDL